MASPKVHAKATGLLAILYIIGFFIGFALSWLDVMWIVVFGVLIDVDHIPFGRLWRAFKFDGYVGVKKSWQKYGWFDADHLDVLHTWWALAVVIIFSIIVGSFWPFVAFGIHMLIDGGSRDQLTYPKCAPLPRDICRYLGRFYPAWAKYHTKGVPVLKK